ncbi:MAG: tetratricopeptide repeat protein [Alphaproteobacteria bacterium]|nr:tetratricopeptide repeat protein [Alphaproteobacteria bacterium]
MRRPGAPDPAFAAAVGLHRAGRLGEAASAYRAILAARPDHVDALHHLGIAALQAGAAADAHAALARAAALAPRQAAIQHDLGHALAGLGRLADAAAAWERAARLAPRMADAHANRGGALATLGRVDEAAAAFRAALQADPNHRLAGLGLADMLLRAGRPDEAVAAADRARVRLGPLPDLAVVKAQALAARGDRAAGAALLEQTVAGAPAHAGAWGALGLARLEAGDVDGAVAAFERAEALDPATAETPFNRATAERLRDRLGACVAALDRAIARRPSFAAARLNRGYALLEQGRVADADAAFDAVLALDAAHVQAASGKLFALNYRDDLPAGVVAEAHRAWGRRFAATPPPPARHGVARDPDRRLRVGYVSADLRSHSVAWFVGPLFAAHDRGAVEVVAYADVAAPDATTARLRQAADLWRPIDGRDDAAVAALVRDDAVDVLVDLAGHTAYNRLGVFARRPAPLQGAWLGYPNTTGLAAIGFRITDAVADPPGAADALHVERLVRLDRPFLCWGPPADAGSVATPSAGPLRFASFNVPAKISAAAVAAWARILAAVPDARLLLKARGLDDPDTAALWRARFADAGVDPGRLELRGRIAATGDHLGLYGTVDIALDPFPYNGTTTTLEALWMGVPVVTLAGDRHAGRVGASILDALGLADLAAGDVDAYVRVAVALARDGGRRAALRRDLRPRLAASALTDAAGFAGALEAAFRAEWRRWCAAGPGP